MAVTCAIRRTILYVTLTAILLLSACAAPAPAEPTQTPAPPTETPAPTLPPTETPLPTATPDPYFIDMDKFHKVPPSYDYLLSHPEVFVKSPDPITDRIAFDSWFQERLVPALGPISGRPINMWVFEEGGSASIYHFIGETQKDPPPTEPLSFFYFVTYGIVYPVTCITGAQEGYEENSKHTLCAALFDNYALSYGTYALEGLNRGWLIRNVTLYFDAISFMSDVNWGMLAPYTRVLGDYSFDENKITFGFGSIEFDSND